MGVAIVVVVFLIGALTPLTSILNPVSGVLQNSRNLVIGNETIRVPGLQSQVTVIQDRYGVFHFYARNLNSLYYAMGFIQAKERLFEIEVFGLEGMGQMAKFFGQSYEKYDTFQSMTGAPLTAQRDWGSVLSNSTDNMTDARTVQALEYYADGINAYINYSMAHNTQPLFFKLLGISPYFWTPVYSYAVQELMTQQLEFGDSGLLYSLIYSLIGNETNTLIPPFSPVQNYYYGGFGGRPNHAVLAIDNDTFPVNSTVASMARTLIQQFQSDPPHYFSLFTVADHSNEWVVAGNRTATGHPFLVGGPVLSFSLPAIWFQVQLVAPGLDVYGVVLPGAPVVVIGFNNNIAWTLTDVQAISDGTFFFAQPVIGNDYIWNGTRLPIIDEYINGMTFEWTNLGPVMVRNGSLALVMDWMGNEVSNEIGALLDIMVSANWTQFREALSIWKAPYQNFAFANSTMIADISPGSYPIFGGAVFNPAGIMPGNGTEYIRGYIPYGMVPHAVNPARGYIVSSNQRQVGPAYPYWFGNTLTFSSGYRAQMEVNYLSTHADVTIRDMMNLQQKNYTDYEAEEAVPVILSDLAGNTNRTVQAAVSLLSSWDYNMSSSSKAASVWFFTYMYLFNNTFTPYLERIGWIPTYKDVLGYPSGMSGSFPGTVGYASMDVDMLHIILNGSAEPFSSVSLKALIEESVIQAMNYLQKSYPSGNYTWGHFYGFVFPNLFGLSEFNVGPIAKGGDFNTPNDASGVGPEYSNYPEGGQSWIMVVNMSNVSHSYGVYPGGQSENPASTQYSNYVNDWIDGTYLPLLFYDSANTFPVNQLLDEVNLMPGG